MNETKKSFFGRIYFKNGSQVIAASFEYSGNLKKTIEKNYSAAVYSFHGQVKNGEASKIVIHKVKGE